LSRGTGRLDEHSGLADTDVDAYVLAGDMNEWPDTYGEDADPKPAA
jgi:hypothetical protein